MYSQCPACLSIYRLRAEQLQAHGVVRCGVCGHHFRATGTLRDRVPELETRERAEDDTLVATPVPAEKNPQPALPLEPEPELPEHTDVEPAIDPPLENDDPLPSLAEEEIDLPLPRARAACHEKRWPWRLAVALLSITALLQAAWLGRGALARLPATAELVEKACSTLPCELSVERHPERIQAVDTSLQAHPSVQGAMLISVTMVNQDERPQPWPIIELKLSDLDEQVVAMRRFRPQEYLQDPKALAAGMPPGQLVPVVLETLDPGRQVVTYTFDFL